MSEQEPPYGGNDEIPNPTGPEKEPQLELIEYFQEIFVSAYNHDFEQSATSARDVQIANSDFINRGVKVLRDPITLDGLSLDQIIITPNIVVPDVSFDEYHSESDVTFRALATTLDDGDGSIFPAKSKLLPYRVFRIKSLEEIDAMPNAEYDDQNSNQAPSVKWAEKSTKFIMMAIPEDKPYPDDYYIVDEKEVSKISYKFDIPDLDIPDLDIQKKDNPKLGIPNMLELGTNIIDLRAKGHPIIPTEEFGGGDVLSDEDAHKEEQAIICEILKSFKRYYSPASIESESWQEPRN